LCSRRDDLPDSGLADPEFFANLLVRRARVVSVGRGDERVAFGVRLLDASAYRSEWAQDGFDFAAGWGWASRHAPKDTEAHFAKQP